MQEDELLMKYYAALPEYDLEVLQKKYTYFTGNQMGGKFDWNGTDIQKVHKNIGKGKKNKCPFSVKMKELNSQRSEKSADQ